MCVVCAFPFIFVHAFLHEFDKILLQHLKLTENLTKLESSVICVSGTVSMPVEGGGVCLDLAN